MVTASYRSLRNWADTTGAKSFGRPSRVRRCPA